MGVDLVKWLLEQNTVPKVLQGMRKRLKGLNFQIGDIQPNASLLQGMLPAAFKYRKAFRAKLQTAAAGHLPFIGELKNASRFMQTNSIPEMIPGVYQMIAALQNTGITGVPINSILAFGGQALINKVASGASSARDSIEKENNELEENSLEAFLRALYRLLKELEPLDAEGNETAEYKAWRAEYILTLGDEFIELYNSRVTS